MNPTDTFWPAIAESVSGTWAVVVPPLPSTTVRSPIVTATTGSSLVMVPVAVPVVIVPLTAPLRVTVKVSAASLSVSPITGTTIGCCNVPDANVRVPDVVV